MRRLLIPLAFGTLLACSLPLGAARLVPNWPYERLFKEADVVVIASATSVERTTDIHTKHSWPLEFTGINTTFELKQMLKGKSPGQQFKVLHFEFGDFRKQPDVARPEANKRARQTQIVNGPNFVEFRTKSIIHKGKGSKWSLPRPEYLLFLKKRADGRFEPISGQIDPNLSVRELYQPSFPESLGPLPGLK